MKQFPRIYSLLTLGIRQHQLFDYKFHPFRTDFVGESGCGKSMIADMLQLVFVGSEVWNSPTESVTPRTVDGMVLKTGRGTEIGYIFLNIQLTASEFIVIGSYLESSSKNSLAFMIHKSWDEDDLQPFANPLVKENFLKNKKILPLDELKRHIESQDLVCHSWQHKKKFHKILYNNKLLSFDLSENEKLLRDYAVIIQSFSRGKALELTESNSLKSFLFGNGKAKEFNRQFKAATQELQAAVHEYGKNKAEISQIVQKQKDILELQGKKEQFNNTQLRYLHNLCVYSHQQEYRSLDDLKDFVKAQWSAQQYLDVVAHIIDNEITECDRQLPELTTKWNKSNIDYKKHAVNHTVLEEIKTIVDKLKLNSLQLKEKYKEQQLMLLKKTLLEEVEKRMKEAAVLELFKKYSSADNTRTLIDLLDEETKKMNRELETHQTLLAFADIKDKTSLGYWALKQKRAFTKEEESVIMQFKHIKTTKPNAAEAGARYIPMPESILNGLSITEPDEKGFWMHLKGMREYIEQVEQQQFTRANLKNIEQVLTSLAKNLRLTIEQLQKNILGLESLRGFILNESRFNEFLSAYKSIGTVTSYNFLPELNISEEQLENYLDVLANASKIESEFQSAYENWGKYNLLKIETEGYRSKLSEEKEKFSVNSNNLGPYSNHLAFKEISPLLELVDDKKPLEKEIQSQLKKAKKRLEYLSKMIFENRSKLSWLTLQQKWEDYQKQVQQKKNAWQEYLSAYFKEPDTATFTKDSQPYPSKEEVDFRASKQLYEQTFDALVEKYHLAEGYRFKEDRDVVELSKILLPEAFKAIEIKEEAIIDTIARYLSSINEKNRELSKRKLQKIQDILEQVKDEISNNVEFAKRIDLFLNSQEREITGGYRARLKLGGVQGVSQDMDRQFY